MRSYIEVPIGIGLIPCDTLIEDRITGKKTIVGVIGAIRVSHFPCIYPSFHLLVSLTGGNGVYPCLLQVVSESKDEVVFSGNGELTFRQPNQVVDLVFLLRHIQFNYPDTYWIKFLVDGEPLMTRPLQVPLLDPPPTPAGPEKRG